MAIKWVGKRRRYLLVVAVVASILVGPAHADYLNERVVLLRLETQQGARAATLTAVERIEVARLRDAGISARVSLLPPDRVRVKFESKNPLAVTDLLTARGICYFRILPAGERYNSIVRVIKTARYTHDRGNQVVIFTVSDPRRFAKFTEKHIGQHLGIFVDDKLVSAPEIAGPIGGEGEIGGAASIHDLRFIAALMNSEPLPVAVHEGT